jgi:ABC-type phosphate transport system substrate-binding protein
MTARSARTTVALLALALLPSLAAAEPIAVVVSPDNSLSSVSTEELKSLFLGRRQEWPDGTRVIAIDLASSSPARAAFDEAVMNMSPSSVESYWVDQRVRGQGGQPKVAPSPAIAVKLAARVRGAVAYVPLSAVDASVKVLWVNGARPGQAGYPINGP